MKYMAFDPGGQIGYAFTDDCKTIHQGSFPKDSATELMNDWFHKTEAIICEDFTPRGRLYNGDALKVIGMLELLAAQNNVKMIMQQPAQVKQFWTDERLKQIGLHKGTNAHSRDATRHLLYYLAFTIESEYIIQSYVRPRLL